MAIVGEDTQCRDQGDNGGLRHLLHRTTQHICIVISLPMKLIAKFANHSAAPSPASSTITVDACSLSSPASLTMLLNWLSCLDSSRLTVSYSLTRPESITSTLVLSRMVLRRCAIVSTVQSAKRVRIVRWISESVSPSTDAVASSVARNGG